MKKICLQCKNIFSKNTTDSKKYFMTKRLYCSQSCYGMAKNGYKWNDESKKKLSKSMMGHRSYSVSGLQNKLWSRIIITCKECKDIFLVRNYRKNSAKFCSKICASRNRNFGLTPFNEKIRKSAAYKAWRTLVFERDNYTCQVCGIRGSYLHADHIKPFAYYPELRLSVDNGRTLCLDCHKKTGTYGVKSWRYQKQNLAILNNF